MVTEDRLKRIRASICLLPDPGYEVAIELLEEIARLREGLRLITCESVNAEYMAQNILDGLPAYHDTMLVPNETPNPQLSGGVAVRLSARLGVTSEDDNMDNPQEREKRLATNAAEEFVRCNGIPTGAPDQFVFHGADLADEYLQDCLAHLKWAGECVVFEHDEETTVILGDYTLGSFE